MLQVEFTATPLKPTPPSRHTSNLQRDPWSSFPLVSFTCQTKSTYIVILVFENGFDRCQESELYFLLSGIQVPLEEMYTFYFFKKIGTYMKNILLYWLHNFSVCAILRFWSRPEFFWPSLHWFWGKA
jgi:hypothetical protein